MAEFDELKDILRQLLTNKFAPKPDYTRGLLGDGQGNVIVPDKTDHNYVRFNRGSTEFFEVFNKTVNPIDGWPILIGELPWQPGLTQVVGTDWAAYEQSGWGESINSSPAHAPTHEWPDGAPGSDPVNVHLRSIVPGRAYVQGTGSTTVFVNSFDYEYLQTGTNWPGLPGFDLSPVMASMSTGNARLIGIYLDPSTKSLAVVTGTQGVFTAAFDPPSPTFPAKIIPIANIRVYGGQSKLSDTDIRDKRILYTLGNTILDPATTVTSGTSFGLSPIVGTSLNYAREDHDHGTPTGTITLPSTSVVEEKVYGLSSAVGTSLFYARQDHTHGTPTGTADSEYNDGGEARGKDRTLGNTDNFDLGFITNDTDRLHIENDGDIGIGITTPSAKLEILNTTAPQLRLTHTSADIFTDFEIDSTNELNIAPSSTGTVVFQPTTDTTHFLQIQDAAGTPILNVDATNERVGIGTVAPTGKLQIDFTTVGADATLIVNRTDNRTVTVADIPVALGVNYVDVSSANRVSAQPLRFQYLRLAGTTGVPTLFDALIVTAPIISEDFTSGELRGIQLEGANVAAGKTLTTFSNLYISVPTGAGTITNNYAMVTASGAGNVGINTTSPDTSLQVVGDTKLGDDNTNYVEVGTTGDVKFVGGGGLLYGEISAVDNSTQTTISVAGTPVQITIFDTNGPSNGTTPDHTNDHITIATAGDYFIAVSATVNSIAGAASRFQMTVQKNNGASTVGALHCDRNIAGGGGVSGVVSMSGIAALAASDTIEVWIENETNTQNYIVENITLSLMQIGG